jgi:basic membrane lipoprotein Med (substrate-binding protein (PBP1-ABC) superfamily)
MGLNVVSGSVLKLFDVDIYESIQQFAQGIFKEGHFTKKMEEGKSSFLLNDLIFNENAIPDEFIQRAIEKENQQSK